MGHGNNAWGDRGIAMVGGDFLDERAVNLDLEERLGNLQLQLPGAKSVLAQHWIHSTNWPLWKMHRRNIHRHRDARDALLA
jgi:hypothetical protein